MEDLPDITRGNLTGRWCYGGIIEIDKHNLSDRDETYWFPATDFEDLEAVLRELRKQEIGT